MFRPVSVLAVFGFLIPCALGGVVYYEGDVFPEAEGWEPNPFCDPGRWIDGGWLVQHVTLCDDYPPPGGQQESFTRTLSDFIGEERFFVEWRMETDGDRSEIPGTAPASLIASSYGMVDYHFTIAADHVRFVRDNTLPIVYVDIEPGLPHTYRLELFSDVSYMWFIDGELIDWGVPEADYPSANPFLGWRAKAWYLENTTQWDYVRYGTTPTNSTGDYDSDGDVDHVDFYFAQECFAASGPDINAGPGCRFTDFDLDGDTDLTDFATFQHMYNGGE